MDKEYEKVISEGFAIDRKINEMSKPKIVLDDLLKKGILEFDEMTKDLISEEMKNESIIKLILKSRFGLGVEPVIYKKNEYISKLNAEADKREKEIKDIILKEIDSLGNNKELTLKEMIEIIRKEHQFELDLSYICTKIAKCYGEEIVEKLDYPYGYKAIVFRHSDVKDGGFICKNVYKIEEAIEYIVKYEESFPNLIKINSIRLIGFKDEKELLKSIVKKVSETRELLKDNKTKDLIKIIKEDVDCYCKKYNVKSVIVFGNEEVLNELNEISKDKRISICPVSKKHLDKEIIIIPKEETITYIME